MQKLGASEGAGKLVLSANQERLLGPFRDQNSLSPQEVWKASSMSRQGAIKVLQPLIQSDLIQRIGTKKNGKYILRTSQNA